LTWIPEKDLLFVGIVVKRCLEHGVSGCSDLYMEYCFRWGAFGRAVMNFERHWEKDITRKKNYEKDIKKRRLGK
jgi:hypothetical protein